MRQLVNTKIFRFKKKLDNILHAILPHYWIPLYSMVGICSMVVENLLSFDLFVYIFKMATQQFKICICIHHFCIIILSSSNFERKHSIDSKVSVNWSWQGRVKLANTIDVCWYTRLSNWWPLNRNAIPESPLFHQGCVSFWFRNVTRLNKRITIYIYIPLGYIQRYIQQQCRCSY